MSVSLIFHMFAVFRIATFSHIICRLLKAFNVMNIRHGGFHVATPCFDIICVKFLMAHCSMKMLT